MILVFSARLVRIFSFGNAQAITLFPFIFLSEKKTENYIINHEKIHIKQQIELLIVPFYLWYGLEFLFYWLKFKNREQAYLSISFEKEAYSNHYDFTFLKKRPFFNHLKYMK